MKVRENDTESNPKGSGQHAESVTFFLPGGSTRYDHRRDVLACVHLGLACSRNHPHRMISDHSTLTPIGDHRWYELKPSRCPKTTCERRRFNDVDLSPSSSFRRAKGEIAKRATRREAPSAPMERSRNVIGESFFLSRGEIKLITVRIAKSAPLIDRSRLDALRRSKRGGHRCIPTCRSISYFPSPTYQPTNWKIASPALLLPTALANLNDNPHSADAILFRETWRESTRRRRVPRPRRRRRCRRWHPDEHRPAPCSKMRCRRKLYVGTFRAVQEGNGENG